MKTITIRNIDNTIIICEKDSITFYPNDVSKTVIRVSIRDGKTKEGMSYREVVRSYKSHSDDSIFIDSDILHSSFDESADEVFTSLMEDITNKDNREHKTTSSLSKDNNKGTKGGDEIDDRKASKSTFVTKNPKATIAIASIIGLALFVSAFYVCDKLRDNYGYNSHSLLSEYNDNGRDKREYIFRKYNDQDYENEGNNNRGNGYNKSIPTTENPQTTDVQEESKKQSTSEHNDGNSVVKSKPTDDKVVKSRANENNDKSNAVISSEHIDNVGQLLEETPYEGEFSPEQAKIMAELLTESDNRIPFDPEEILSNGSNPDQESERARSVIDRSAFPPIEEGDEKASNEVDNLSKLAPIPDETDGTTREETIHSNESEKTDAIQQNEKIDSTEEDAPINPFPLGKYDNSFQKNTDVNNCTSSNVDKPKEMSQNNNGEIQNKEMGKTEQESNTSETDKPIIGDVTGTSENPSVYQPSLTHESEEEASGSGGSLFGEDGEYDNIQEMQAEMMEAISQTQNPGETLARLRRVQERVSRGENITPSMLEGLPEIFRNEYMKADVVDDNEAEDTTVFTLERSSIPRSRFNIPTIPRENMWVYHNGQVSLPLPGGGTIESPGDMEGFGLEP